MLEESHTTAPDINLLIIPLAELHFRGHEESTPAVSFGFVTLEIGNTWHSEVNDEDLDWIKVVFDGLVVVQHDVGKFDVPVVDPAALELIDLCYGLVLLPFTLEAEIFLEGWVVEGVDITVQAVQPPEDLLVNTVNNCLSFGF